MINLIIVGEMELYLIVYDSGLLLLRKLAYL